MHLSTIVAFFRANETVLKSVILIQPIFFIKKPNYGGVLDTYSELSWN